MEGLEKFCEERYNVSTNENGVLDSVMKRLEYYEKVKEQLIKNNTNEEDTRYKWFEGQIYMIELMVFDLKQIIENAS